MGGVYSFVSAGIMISGNYTRNLEDNRGGGTSVYCSINCAAFINQFVNLNYILRWSTENIKLVSIKYHATTRYCNRAATIKVLIYLTDRHVVRVRVTG